MKFALPILLSALATPAAASGFGCVGLDRIPNMPVSEGRDGFFFRDRQDLRNRFQMDDDTIGLVAWLSDALAAKGTTLVYVPIPTKGSMLSGVVPTKAIDGAFDPAAAADDYGRMVDRLRRAGVATADLRQALSKPDGLDPTFFPSDLHWTPRGSSLAAQAVAEEILHQPAAADLPRKTFVSKAEGVRSFPSMMHRSVQKACRDVVASNEAEVFVTTEAESPDGSLDLFGSDEGSGPAVALAGTSFSDMDVFNFHGFLSEFSGFEVANYAISGGNQFASMLSYLSSPEFAATRPAILVWENPVYNNLGQFGPAPLLELAAFASGACEPSDAVETKVVSPDTLVFELPADDAAKDAVGSSEALPSRFVGIDAHDASVREVVLGFDEDGSSRTRGVRRQPRVQATGRFVVPVPPSAGIGHRTVRLRLDRPAAATTKIATCRMSPNERIRS